ncbi:pyridoxamine 5'-phosphate oxidase family protein [Sutterella sp.]|uniref:pyridoxamine 5'-phosphate oxidase family protein n=1 Tax=Sutterella sp. TaxID=1981025 RepID=UPI0026E098F6|nr:pyridoxamine 5'-phosphate oxidase family protein [Sutterella sp.]MDO5530964.1 pyridoxamine 5'-phosphate oxidase family protein [Sutterella sp.]
MMNENEDFLEEAGTRGRPMRRRDRELSLTDALRVVRAAGHAVLSTADSAGIPYGAPVSPALDGETKLYFHTTREKSRKADNMLDSPEVSLCFIAYAKTDVPAFSVDYASAIVQGRAALVIDEPERHHAMMLIAGRYSDGDASEKRAADTAAYWEASGRAVSVWRIDISNVTGKSRGWEKIQAEIAARGF